MLESLETMKNERLKREKTMRMKEELAIIEAKSTQEVGNGDDFETVDSLHDEIDSDNSDSEDLSEEVDIEAAVDLANIILSKENEQAPPSKTDQKEYVFFK